MVNFLDIKSSIISENLNNQDSHYIRLSLINYPRTIQVIKLVTINKGLRVKIYHIQENHVNFSWSHA